MKPVARSPWTIPWVVATGSTLLGLAWLTLGIRLAPLSPASPSPAVPSLTLAHQKESDHLFDLEPLFLPTKSNASSLELPRQPWWEPAALAATFPAKWTLSESSGGVVFPEPVPVPSPLIEILAFGDPPNPWAEVGRADVPVATFPARVAFMEIALAKTGQLVFSVEVPNSTEAIVPLGDWAPLQFLVAVDSSGLVGAPVITGSTANEEVESFFRTFVARTFHLGAHLAPGFYTVRIGP